MLGDALADLVTDLILFMHAQKLTGVHIQTNGGSAKHTREKTTAVSNEV